MGFVIHIVSPKFVDVMSYSKYIASIQSCLELGDKLGIQTIALPLVGCGFLNWSPTLASKLMVQAIRLWESSRANLTRDERSVREIILFDISEKKVEKLLNALKMAETNEIVHSLGNYLKPPTYLWSYRPIGCADFVPFSYADMLVLDEAFVESEDEFPFYWNTGGAIGRGGLLGEGPFYVNFVDMLQYNGEGSMDIKKEVLENPYQLDEYTQELASFKNRALSLPHFVVECVEANPEGVKVVAFGEKGELDKAEKLLKGELEGWYVTDKISVGEILYEEKCDRIKEYLSSLDFEVRFSSLPPRDISLSSLEKEKLRDVKTQISKILSEMSPATPISDDNEDDDIDDDAPNTPQEDYYTPIQRGTQEWDWVVSEVRSNRSGIEFSYTIYEINRIHDPELIERYVTKKREMVENGVELNVGYLKHAYKDNLREKYLADGLISFTHDAYLVARNARMEDQYLRRFVLAFVLMGKVGQGTIEGCDSVEVHRQEHVGVGLKDSRGAYPGYMITCFE